MQTVRSKALVMTSPSLVTAELLGSKEHGVLPAAAELARINCPPVASVTVAYPNSAFKVRCPVRHHNFHNPYIGTASNTRHLRSLLLTRCR